MKPTTFLLLSFLLLTLLATKSSIAKYQESDGLPTPVYDVDGHELTAGTEYYIRSIFSGAGGGVLTYGSATGDPKACPLDVLKVSPLVTKGRPVTFTPVDSTEGVIRVSTDLNIRFSTGILPTCVRSTVWRILKSSNPDKQWSVAIDGVEGNPGPQTVVNWFQIQQDDFYGYKLTFCPTGICHCDVLCRDISLYAENRTASLVLNGGQTFRVLFFKANPESIDLINAE